MNAAIPSFAPAEQRSPARSAAAPRAAKSRRVSLMGRLSVRQKLVLMVLAGAVPLALAIWCLASMQRVDARASLWARQGVVYEAQVFRLVQALQGYRDLAAAAARGDAPAKAKADTRSQDLEERIRGIDAIDATLGSSAARSEQWLRAKQQARAAVSGTPRGGAEDLQAHTTAIATLLGLIGLEGDEAHVRFGAHPVAYYLADIVTGAGPDLSELIARLRTDGAALTRRALSDEEARDLQRRLTLLQAQTARVKTDLAKLAAADDGLRQVLEKVRLELDQAVAQFADTVQLRVVHPRDPGIAANTWWDQASRALERAAGVTDVSASILTDLLEQRHLRHAGERQWVVGWLLAGILLSLAVSVWVIRDLHRRLVAAVRSAEQVAVGDLATPADLRGRTDELGRLGTALGDIAGAIEGMVSGLDRLARGDLSVDVRPRSTKDASAAALAAVAMSLRSLVQMLSNTVGALTSATGDVARGVANVNGGTTQTLTAVDAAAVAVRGLRRSAVLANERASELSGDALSALRVSESGRRAADEAMVGLNRIQEQIQSINASVVRLGDHSRGIGEIIAAVDGVAERANLLAVNASIEAAKAGEHSQGFAVVAKDVRVMAELASQAGAQVRALLTDLQKASNVAVMVTEQGAKSAEVGVRQSLEASASFRQIAQQIGDAAEVVGCVTSSSAEQLEGIEQAIAAMQRVRETSVAHAEDMRQIEAAAQNLTEVSAQMQNVLNSYRLNGERAA